MRFTPRSSILLATLIALPVASWWFVFREQNTRIAKTRQDIELQRSVLEKLKEETARNADLARANDQIKKSIEAIETRLPSGKEIDSVVRQVSDLAIAAGLDAPGLKSAKPVKAALYMEQPLEMTLDGDFAGFYSFLVNLEALPRITRIPDLTLKSSDNETSEMRAAFTLSIYFQDKDNPANQTAAAGGAK
ncbi:MAG: type 4a pilus biogenesis protein PilO [Planctomycetes bacterium]|nr:type 4a pilus biogenesis protein PilO [Planctomycetota bacterium]